MTNKIAPVNYTVACAGGEDIYRLYLDQFFLLNSWFTFCLMEMTVVCLECSVTHFKIALWSFLVTAYECMILFALNGNGWVKFLCAFPVGTFAMIYFLFPKRKMRVILHIFLCYLFITVVAGGSIALLAKLSGIHMGTLRMNIGMGGTVVIFRRIVRKIKSSGKTNDCRVMLGYRGREITLRAMVDSGNSLIEPVSGKAVSLVSQNHLPNDMHLKPENFKVIPFHAVGTENGLLPGYEMDYMRIEYGTQLIRIEKPVIGISDHELFTKHHYQMILHPELLNEREELI